MDRRVALSMPLRGLAERRETARETRQFAGGGVLVQHAAGDAAGQLRLDAGDGRLGLILVAGLERRFDLLHERPDAADPGAVDVGPLRVAKDALLCLRRIRHLKCLVSEKKRARPRTAPAQAAPSTWREAEGQVSALAFRTVKGRPARIDPPPNRGGAARTGQALAPID